MSKIVMEQEELEEILDNYDYKKSLFISGGVKMEKRKRPMRSFQKKFFRGCLYI